MNEDSIGNFIVLSYISLYGYMVAKPWELSESESFVKGAAQRKY